MPHFRIILLVALSLTGVACSDAAKARVGVAKDNTLRKIDEMLGTLDVKRKEVTLSLQSLKDAVAGMGKAKIKSQVKLEQLDQKAQGFHDQIARADATLKKVRGYLAANEAVEISGKTYTPEDLNRMATQVLDARKGYTAQVGGIEKSQEALRQVAATMERNQTEYQGRITALEAKLTEIDSQMVAIRSMKDASSAMGDSRATLAENVTQLEDKVADLLAGTRAELSTEGNKWNSADAESKIDSAEAFISATQATGNALEEINRVLGNAQ